MKPITLFSDAPFDGGDSRDVAVPSAAMAGTGKEPLKRSLAEFTITELKDELIRRGCADFSKWEVLIKLSPFILLLAMGVLWKAGTLADGSYLSCIFG
jgi:hypothetical protein